MTTIFKVADHDRISPTLETMEASMTREAGMEVPGQAWPTALDDAGLVDEMEKIEKCASGGKDYMFNADWPADQVAQLREYAAVCDLKGRMIPAKQAKAEPQAKVEDDDPETRKLAGIVAKAQPKVASDLAIAVGDPFHLSDDRAPEARENWQKVTPEQKLDAEPQISARAGSVAPIRGEYEYASSPTLRVRRGENSVADPDAIGKLAKEEDTGARLKADNANARTERQSARTMWEKEAIAKAKGLGAGALPRGNVFMTAAAPVAPQQSGLDAKAATAELVKDMPKVTPDLPDLTDGEKLHQANKDRKTSIQREASSDDWQKVKGSTRPSLTDDFANALEFQLGKVGITVQAYVDTRLNARVCTCDQTKCRNDSYPPVKGGKCSCGYDGEHWHCGDCRGRRGNVSSLDTSKPMPPSSLDTSKPMPRISSAAKV